MFRSFLIIILLATGFCKGPEKPKELPVPAPKPELSLDELHTNLQSKNWRKRSSAILALARLNNRDSLPQIRHLLKKDPNASVRATAALGLARLNDTSSALEIAKKLQQDKEVAADALLSALKTLKEAKTASYIVPVLDSTNHVLRLVAVDTLATIDNQNVSNNILTMAEKEANRPKPDASKIKTYLMVLGKLQAKQSGPFILKIATRYSPSPTLAAAYLALGRVKYQPGMDVLALAIGNVQYPKGRENAVIALKAMADSKSHEKLFPYLQHEQKSVRMAAAEVIADLPNEISSQKVLKYLQEKKQITYGPAAFILGRYRYEPARLPLEKILRQANNPAREQIAIALGWLGNKESISLLEKVLVEPSGEGRYGAILALGLLKSTGSLPLLQKIATNSDKRLQQLAIESMALIGSSKSLPFLQQRTRSNPALAVYTLSAIASIPGEKSIQILGQMAQNSNSNIQRAALQAIAQKKDPILLPTVMQVLVTSSGEIEKNAIFALRALTGLKFHYKNEWFNWYQNRTKK